MPVPASILQILETNNISYELSAYLASKSATQTTEKACLVKAILLKDSSGLVQVVLSSNRLLDLNTIEAQSGRKLSTPDRAEVDALLAQHGLSAVPAFPQWQDLSTMVDSHLLDFDTLWLETGDREQMVTLKKDAFCALVETTSINAISLPTPVLNESSDGDVEQINQSVQSFTNIRIKQRLEDTLDLPPLPETAQKIIQLRSNPESDISDLTDIVELDPSLAAQVVSWAASPYYSAPGKIKSVHDAIVRVLGFDMVLNLALGLSLGKTMNTEVISNQQMNDYWRHAVCVAAAVEGLVTSIPREHRPAFGVAYLSGLLCNFGYLILAEIFPPYFETINRYTAANPHISPAAVEQHSIDITSCQIASWLMEYWSMPEEVVSALRQQYNGSFDGEHKAYSQLIYVAEQLLARNGFSRQIAKPIPNKIFEDLHLNQETANTTITQILESADDLQAIANQMSG